MAKIHAVICLLFTFSVVSIAQDTSYLSDIQNAVKLMQGGVLKDLNFGTLANLLSKMDQNTVLQSVMKVLTENKNTSRNSTNVPDFPDISKLPQLLGAFKDIPGANEIITDLLQTASFSNVTELISTSKQFLSSLTASGGTLLGLLDIFSTDPLSQYHISEKCSDHMFKMITAIMSQDVKQNMWAFQMLDSMGKIPVGIFEGNLKSLGSFDECRRVKASILDTVTNQKVSPFSGKYCTVNVPLKSVLGPLIEGLGKLPDSFTKLTAGICIPDSCSEYDVLVIINKALQQLQSNVLHMNATIWATESTCQDNEQEFDAKAIGALFLCGFFVALMVLGTAYDVIYVQWPKKKAESENDTNTEKNMKTTTNGFTHGENAPEMKYKPDRPSDFPVDNKQKIVVEKPGIAGKLILSFSVYTNGKKLLNTAQGAGTITSVNGIRFLSMSWVILGHTYAFIQGVTGNLAVVLPDRLNRWTTLAIANATISVDTFFALSGLLLSYLILKELEKKKGVCGINWGIFYFHRFWRLTPPYMLILFVYVSIRAYVSDGPLWPKHVFEQNVCGESWWTNLLYINNFVKTDKMCFGWSWYLSNDMQFYVLSPLLFIPLFYNVFIGVIVCGAFLISATIAPGIISSENNLPPSTMGGVDAKDPGNFMDLYYIKPYCRMGPYVVGILTGYLLYKTKCKLRIHWFLNICIWLFAAGVACAILYGMYDAFRGKNLLSVEVAAFYNAVHRTSWGLCVCWVIVACATGNGGYVNTLLSWKGFIPVARLTYCAYLVHPILMYVYYFSVRTPIHLKDLTMIYLFFAHLTSSYLVAFVLSLAFESPMMGLEKVIFGQKSTKKEKKSKNNGEIIQVPQVVKTAL